MLQKSLTSYLKNRPKIQNHLKYRYLNVLFGCSSCDGSGAVLRVKSSGPDVVTGASGSWLGKVTGIGAGGNPGTSCVKINLSKAV